MVKKASGFTLIEVMIVVVIIGILASIAYPSYIDFVTRSNRAEAHAALMKVANLQEQYYLDNRKYTSSMSDIGVPVSTASNYYEISTTVASGGFTTFAKVVSSSVQKRDTQCQEMSINDKGEKKPSECW
ncbi:prepilin-type N-terminal cleavage/methylation domain-containing protein [Shewanella avicenniae]|uniref:Prepilin-type N-terminal cleavage/methylation domain-containing protein n=2 Tax=Shewanella avicenniae TaxID=2814294 RepID=A0ABX7QV68_9GAMM|nr:prepilin-type N-terminal cleavage/methylation domain-containing protein [Shewanella avicenniae]